MRVLVTGANGHLGFNLAAGLIERGYTVRAGVRSAADSRVAARLKALGVLEIVDADLSRPDELRAAVDGQELLFHAAAVFSIERARAGEMQDASVGGTRAILRAAADARVRKVVLTSSAATLPMVRPGEPPVDETRWADDLRVPYFRAKTEGEQAAWQAARDLGLNLVSLLPGSIIGPGFVRNTPTIDFVDAAMRNSFRLLVPDANLTLVDIRDAVRAHVLAAERDCDGRFAACYDTAPSLRSLVETMHGIDPAISRPLATAPAFLTPLLPTLDAINRVMRGSPRLASPDMLATIRGKVFNVSNQRIAHVLGWRPSVPIERSLRDTMRTLRELHSG